MLIMIQIISKGTIMKSLISPFLLLASLRICLCHQSNDLSVKLEAPWVKTSFELNLIESIAAIDETLYVPTILSLYGLSEDEDDEDDDQDESNSDEESKYYKVIKSLDQTAQSLMNFDLVNRIHSPRIIAHHEYYNRVVQSQYGERLTKECSVDSFGNKLLQSPEDSLSSWVLYNSKLYCSADDLFALRTDKAFPLELQEFDRVIGTNAESPILILYSDPKSGEFVTLFDNLYQNALAGKLRFVWRYVPDKRLTTMEKLSGYGVDVSVKRSDYIVIDDKDVKASKKESTVSKASNLKLEKDIWKILDSTDLKTVLPDGFEDLALKFSSFVLDNPYSNTTKYELLEMMLNNFPKFAFYISQSKKSKSYEPLKKQIAANEEVGASADSYGFYVNGSPIHKLELDLLTIVGKVKKELRIVQQLVQLGLTVEQSKLFVVKFALLSAVKQSQFRNGNTVMGFNENRFKLYEHVFTSGSFKKKKGVVFFNDIEKDGTYEMYTANREEAYLKHRLQPSQIPPLRENVHDLIFALNFANKGQLRVFFTLSKVILDTGIPQQLGVIAVASEGDELSLDHVLAKTFYFICDTSSAQEGLAFLYKYYETKDDVEVEMLLKGIKIPEDYDFNHSTYKDTLERFSIDTASIIFNGVIHELRSPTWQIAMGNQLKQDISLLRQYVSKGKATDKSLKSLLYENSKSERNLRVLPLDPSEVIYKLIDSELIENSIALKPEQKPQGEQVSGTFWIIGDFQRQLVVDQLKEILRKVKEQSYALQVRLINTGSSFPSLQKIQKLNLNSLSSTDIDKILRILEESRPEGEGKNFNTLKLLERKNLPVHQDFILFNSRYFRLTSVFKSSDLDLALEYEFNQRISIFHDLVNAYPETFGFKSLNEINTVSNHDNFDWFDMLTSVISKSFYVDDNTFDSDVSRFDFSSLDMTLSLNVSSFDARKEVDILLIVDPIDEYSQKMVAIVNSIKDMTFVNVKILLQSRAGIAPEIGRFYKGVFPSVLPEFTGGKWSVNNEVILPNLPESEIFSTSLDVPSKWISVVKSSNVDLDNIKIENLIDKKVKGSFELKSLLIEGYARDVSKASPPISPVSLEISNRYSARSSDTSIMLATKGYFQLQASPGTWELKLQSGNYSVLSAAEGRFIINDRPVEAVNISVFELSGRNLQLRLKTRTEGEIGVKIQKEDSDVVNVFSIASGHLYERLISIMMLSVREHTKSPVKFWIVENFISGNFKNLLPVLAETHGFQYEFVTYKWPAFLRQQREKQREIWGYKILFLDVLFPQTLDKVIFIDADQIVRTDLVELNKIDLEGKPYAFTPMCDSREDMEGFRFWKSGYWSKVLEDDLKYHISAMFVVDLRRFREMHAGDQLRSHYQKLSSDPNSLSNLDQDLPNNLQRSLPIFSLPQEWLWCETWCSTETLRKAKAVDLCNNPLTKESKLDQAKRLIPEWTGYDEEVEKLRSKVREFSEVIEEEGGLDVEPDVEIEEKEPEYEIEHDEL